MAGPIAESLNNKSFLIRLSNVSLDIVRTITCSNLKRMESFKACALEQLNGFILESKNESEKRELGRIKEIFLDIMLDPNERKYYGTREQFINYLNTFIFMGER